jgi:putative NADH-flavin reductase
MIDQRGVDTCMRIAIFGATGRTGLLVVAAALRTGHEVTAHTRSPAKLAAHVDELRIVEGDLADSDSIDRAIDRSDAVISVLGPSNNEGRFVVSNGMEKIVASMKKHGVRRLIATAGAGVPDSEDQPTFMSKVMQRLVSAISRNVFEDMVRTVEIIRHSDLSWTIVRVPMLVDGRKTGQVKPAWVGKGMRRQISRADLAEFVVGQLQDDAYIGMAPAVSSFARNEAKPIAP